MRKLTTLTLALFTIVFIPALGFTQQPDSSPSSSKSAIPAQYYKLSYSIEELGESGKVTNSRTYSTSVSTGPQNGPPAEVRTGSKLPLKTNDKGDVNYIDVGVNLDVFHAHEVNGKLSLQISAEISSVTPSNGEPASTPPVIRQNRFAAVVLVPVGKPTIIFSSDNLDNRGKLQVELTATRIE